MADLETPLAVRVAATLRIADHIAGGRRTLPELAECAAADPDALGRVLRHLTGAGILGCDPDGAYSLTASGEALRDDHPDGMRAVLDMEGAIGHADLSYIRLLHSVRTGLPAYPELYGTTFWEDLAANPERSGSFYERLEEQATAWGPAVASGYPWDKLEHVVDVGGGAGSLLAALLTRFPALSGTIVDLPAVTRTARLTLAEAGLAARSDTVSGSFFDPLPAGADAYLLAQVLHDWNDDDACRILRRCAEAAGKDGIVLIVERTTELGESMLADMDLRMLVYFGGRERTARQFAALGERAGLRLAAVHAAVPLSIIELAAA
jgi:O-methyltransferase domain